MKRYCVIKKQSANNEHLNELDLLPASCKRITGIAVCTTVKSEADAIVSTQAIAFPQGLIKRLLASDDVAQLFYSYMKTRPTEEESKSFFETDILPPIAEVLVRGIQYPILTTEQHSTFSSNISDLLIGGSEQPEIDWTQREASLKAQSQTSFFDFISAYYNQYGVNPEEDLNEDYVNLLFNPASRAYALYRITLDVYYTSRNNGFNISYSTFSRDINTYGNTIMQGYDRGLSQLQSEKKASEELETQGLAHYLFSKVGLYEKGKTLSNEAFAELIVSETLSFIYQNKGNLFTRPVDKYQRPEPYECGKLSLLVNGNSFLLRDFILTANRKVKHLSKEIIPFYEPLEVNSSLQTIYKSNLKSSAEPLNIRVYIQYEDFKAPLANVEIETKEVKL